jgi:hypothetical protein
VEQTWLTVPQLRAEWPDAPRDQARLEQIADAAYETVLEYAPRLPDGAAVPARYKQALAMHAREVWNAAARDTADSVGLAEVGQVVRLRPLSGAVG